MHGRNPTNAPVLAAGRGAESDPAAAASPHDRQRPGRQGPDALRHIFHAPGPEEAFRAGGLIDPSGRISEDARQRIYALATRLEARMWRSAGALWQDPLPNDPAAEPAARTRTDNPSLPAGYTYLLQLIGHDVVDSVRSAVVIGDGTAATMSRNARRRSLMLDTVYGDGPDECPQAYDEAGADSILPRTLLRLGTLRRDGTPPAEPALPAEHRCCPFRDIARASAEPAAARPAAGRLVAGEALVADPRNDAHALLSQLTVLFHLLHNTVTGMVGEAMGTPPLGHRAETVEHAYRRFLAARFIVTLTYRNIVEQDVLPRVLDARVLAAYRDNPGLRLDEDAGEGAGIPLEVSAGAFRFGHAMVQEHYRANRDVGAAGLRFSGARDQSSRHNPANVPVTRGWAVDWSLFFGTDDGINLSRRIGPFVTGSLMQEGPRVAVRPLPDGLGFEARGLPSRDLLTACHAGLWSVPALCRHIRGRLRELGLGDDLLPDYDVWKRPLAAWLKDYEGAPGPHQLSTEDIDRLVQDPPLPFFILFEAAHELDDDRRPRTAEGGPIPGAGGRRLGPLGSLLLADTLFGALRAAPFGFDETGLTLAERLEKVVAALVATTSADGAAALMAQLDRPLDAMADVLAFLHERKAFLA